MVVATARGAFRKVAGTIVANEPNPHLSSVEVSIDVASIDTGEERRDAHLRSPDFFDAERFPTIEFRSRRVEPMGGDRYRLTGELTMRGITREITFDASYLGQIADSKLGIHKAGFEGELTVDRRDFGL